MNNASYKKKDKIESIRILKFSGTKEDWSVWEEKFIVCAKGKGYKDTIKGKTTIPDDNKVIDNHQTQVN